MTDTTPLGADDAAKLTRYREAIVAAIERADMADGSMFYVGSFTIRESGESVLHVEWDGSNYVDDQPRIEVIHDREPDSSCDVRVFIDGQQVEKFTEYSIDPGAGHARADWDETTAAEVAVASPAVAVIVKELRDYAAENSGYIEGPR